MRTSTWILFLLVSAFMAACSDFTSTSYTDDALLEREQLAINAQREREAIAKSPCYTPWGDRIEAGQKVRAFKIQTTCDGDCEEEGILRECKNGVLSGSNDYMYKSCREDVCESCELPWGGLLLHGEESPAYRVGEKSCSDSCEDRLNTGVVRCENGELEGVEEYPFGSCTQNLCSCALPWNPDEFIPHGSSITAYQAQEVNCLTTCESQSEVRTCDNGVLTGSAAFQFPSCQVLECRSCTLPSGDPLGHGLVVPAYRSPQSTCETTCDDTSNLGSLECRDGELLGISDFPHTSCSPRDCSCAAPWNPLERIPDGASVTAYRQETVACQSSCSTVAQERVCENGELSGTGEYQFGTCEPEVCDDCVLPWGGTLPHGQQTTAYRSSESTCDESCDVDSNRGVVSCVDGVLSGLGEFPHGSCSPRDCSCSLPWNPGETIGHGDSVSAYSSSTVACGSSCAPLLEVRECNNRVLSGSFQYGSCEADCVECQHTLADGSVIHLVEGGTRGLSARAEALQCDTSCEDFEAVVQCQREGDLPRLEIIEPDDPDFTLNDLRYAQCTRPDTMRCTSGGNPPRACAVPGGYGLFGDESHQDFSGTTMLHHPRYDRPPHTKYPNGPRSWIQSFELRGQTLPYGQRGFTDSQGRSHSWFYHISPDTVLTFYDTPVVDQRVNPEDHCDLHALAKRCDPDGYFIPASASGQDRGGIGPGFEPTDSLAFKYTHCRTIPADDPTWLDEIVDWASCLIEDEPGACLIQKNPFFANNHQPVSSDAEIASLQRRSVNWSDPSSSGLLQSESFRIFELFTDNLNYCEVYTLDDQNNRQYTGTYRKIYSTELKSPSVFDSTTLPGPSFTHRLSYEDSFVVPVENDRLISRRDYPALRIQLFYGLEYIREFLIDRFGRSLVHFEERAMNVIQGDPSFANNAAFIRSAEPLLIFGPKLRLVFEGGLVKEEIQAPYNIDLSVVVHELGHTNAFYANGIITRSPLTTVTDCGPEENLVCCTSSAGCYSAIDEGQADFLSAIVYPDSPAVGDGISQTTSGISSCGLPRNPSMNHNLTLAQAFNACPESMRGQIHAMGAVYAAIWWSVREAVSTENRIQVERLFLEHLKYLSATDTFLDASDAVAQAEIALFGSASYFTPLFQAEMLRRQ